MRRVILCYVMWNLFTVGSLQFRNEANQNRLKIKNYVSKYIKFLCFMYIKAIIVICVNTKTSKLHKPSMWVEIWKFLFWSETQNFLKIIYRDGSLDLRDGRPQHLRPCPQWHQSNGSKPLESSKEPNSDVAGFDNLPLIT